MGGAFGVGCGWFFFGALSREEAGKRQRQGTYNRVVFAERHALSNSPIYFYILSSGGFAAVGFRPSRKVPSILDALGSARALFRLRQPDDLVYASIYVKGLLLLVPPPRSCVYVAYAHAFYVVMCYMSITCICQLYVLKC